MLKIFEQIIRRDKKMCGECSYVVNLFNANQANYISASYSGRRRIAIKGTRLRHGSRYTPALANHNIEIFFALLIF